MKNHILLIPAFNPKDRFIKFVEQLVKNPFFHVVIINDGSHSASAPIFEEIKKIARVTILEHTSNKGKGAAVKTGLDYITHAFTSFDGVITVAADGQHELEDVLRISNSTRIFGNSFILGVRKYASKKIPIVHVLAYKLSSILFDVHYKKRLKDVQSGLRYLPRQHVNWLVNIQADGSEYDVDMLIEAIERNIQIYEVPIGNAKMTQNEFLQYDGSYKPFKFMKRKQRHNK